MSPSFILRAALFDMDGTLFDTETIYRDAWLSAGVPEELYRSYIGTPRSYIKQLLAAHGFDPEEIYVYKDRYVEKALAAGIPVKPGAEAFLRWLQARDIPAVVATSSLPETARNYVRRAGLEPYFAEIVSGSQVAHGKPAPDIFLFAAERIGAAPEGCAVFEDSFNGVRAGHAAGMYTVMVPDAIPPDEEMQKTADVILPSLADAPACFCANQ